MSKVTLKHYNFSNINVMELNYIVYFMKLKVGLYLGNNIQGLQVRLIARYPRQTVGDNRI